MSTRYADLKKIPRDPAARLLAAVNAKLDTPLDTPASASVATVLEKLEQAAGWIDMLRLLTIALPPREAVWWGCLAARDVMGEGDKNATPCLKAAEAWVFNPTEENRNAVRVAMDAAYPDDRTPLLGLAAFYAAGNMGSGELAEHPAPPGAVANAVFGYAAGTFGSDFEGRLHLLIDRALDIARGGDGRIEIDKGET